MSKQYQSKYANDPFYIRSGKARDMLVAAGLGFLVIPICSEAKRIAGDDHAAYMAYVQQQIIERTGNRVNPDAPIRKVIPAPTAPTYLIRASGLCGLNTEVDAQTYEEAAQKVGMLRKMGWDSIRVSSDTEWGNGNG
jgi:hypothetical protein